MAAYRRVCDSRHLQADCQEPGSAPEPYTRQSCMGYLYLFYETIKHFISFIIMLTDDGLCENNMLILWKKPRLSSVSQLIHKQTAKTTTESTFM